MDTTELRVALIESQNDFLTHSSRRMFVGFRINTNVVSLSAQRHLGLSKQALDKSLERLASGQKINRASDDAAGMAISEDMNVQIRGLQQAKRNSQDGISLAQIAEGALSQVANVLIRLRELAIQASSDTVGEQERGFLDVEFQQLLTEANRIISSTEFNGVRLLNGSGKALDIQIGIGNDPSSDRLTFNSSLMSVNTATLGLDSVFIKNKNAAQNSLPKLDRAMTLISKVRADLGGLQNRLQTIIASHNLSIENLSAANSRLRDTDLAEETAEMAKGNILVRAATSVLAQANQTASSALDLLNASV